MDKLELQSHSIHSLLSSLSRQAKVFVQRVNLSETSDAIEVDLAKEILAVYELVELGIKNLRIEQQNKEEERKLQESKKIVVNSSPDVTVPSPSKEQVNDTHSEQPTEQTVVAISNNSQLPSMEEEEKESLQTDEQLTQEYEKYLKGLQFDTSPIIVIYFYSSSYAQRDCEECLLTTT